MPVKSSKKAGYLSLAIRLVFANTRLAYQPYFNLGT